MGAVLFDGAAGEHTDLTRVDRVFNLKPSGFAHMSFARSTALASAQIELNSANPRKKLETGAGPVTVFDPGFPLFWCLAEDAKS